MKTLETLTKDEKSLLLFLETRYVDYGGRVDIRHMNKEDMEIAKSWDEEHFLGFGRIIFDDVNSSGSHWVELTEDSINLAHQLRKERAIRMHKNRKYTKTIEKNIN